MVIHLDAILARLVEIREVAAIVGIAPIVAIAPLNPFFRFKRARFDHFVPPENPELRRTGLVFRLHQKDLGAPTS